LREWFNILRQLLAECDLSNLSPAVGVLAGKIPGYGYAASTDSHGRYLLYLVDEQVYFLKPCEDRKLEISLSLPPGRYSAVTLYPGDGKRSPLHALISNGKSSTTLSLRFSEDVAVILNRI